ncbi:MAG TPA: NAD(P)-binding protein, partial [Solirubrobacteraceae bacterium]
MSKDRVVILGGGVGGVTAAMALSEPGWEDHFASITLYQQGWRLGGKGASGRGDDRRIEEHGLHIWFGFYENAFRLLDHCHKELDRLEAQEGVARWKTEFRSVPESFLACDHITLTDYDGCRWKPWSADFFQTGDDKPWLWPDPREDGERPDDWSAVFYLQRCIRLAGDLVESLFEPGDTLAIVPGVFDADPHTAITTAEEVGGSLNTSVKSLAGALTGNVHGALELAAETLDAVIEEGAEFPLALDVIDIVLRVLDVALEFVRGRADQLIRHNDAARRAWYVVDLMLAISRGLIADGVLEEDDLDVINEYEFRAWLLKHGAARESADCALVRAVVYDLAFAYSGGDPRRPAAEAGTALRGLLRAFFTYRGALMWKMNSGMGDTIFAPIYELLDKRGVEVKFFHRVEQLRVDDKGYVSEIDIDVQTNAAPANVLHVAAPSSAMAKGKAKGTDHATALWPAKPDLHQSAKAGAPPPPAEDWESWLVGRTEQVTAESKTIIRGAKSEG